MTDTCQTCPFWKALTGYGKCFRFPPTIGRAGEVCDHPKTLPSDWCAEHPENKKEVE